MYQPSHSSHYTNEVTTAHRTSFDTLASHVTLRAVDPLASNIGLPSSQSQLPSIISTPEVTLKQEDHPQVTYWTREQWMKSKDKGDVLIVDKDGTTKEPSRGIAFLQTTTGAPVSHARGMLFREFARSIWHLIARNQPRKLPKTWGKAGLDILNLFDREMRLKFPEFALCDDGWKAKIFATEYYPSWYKGVKLGEGNTESIIKEEEVTRSRPTSPAPAISSKKHTLPLEVCQPRKKAKTEKSGKKTKTKVSTRSAYSITAVVLMLYYSPPNQAQFSALCAYLIYAYNIG